MVLTATVLIGMITVLVLSIFLGFELITKVPPTLHTPLMSGANAISGITIVGALMASNAELQGGSTGMAAILGCLALILATINCVGGFMVTGRMLEMFKPKKGA
jgi:NAD(P) transhydrogenase subunit alpha